MTIATASPLYHEQLGRVTPPDEIDAALGDLAIGAVRIPIWTIHSRREMVEQCLAGVMATARDWVAACAAAKGIDPNTPLVAEEIAAGPMATVRYLRLLADTLRRIGETGRPLLPGRISSGPHGQIQVSVFPCEGLFDPILFRGFRAHVWLRPEFKLEEVRRKLPLAISPPGAPGGIALVLGAGNVSSIAPTDALDKLFRAGRTVLLKMNPVNEYLGPIFRRAFAPLVEAGFLQIIYGGAETGAYAINHPLVNEVHITGSVQAHDAIVWGPPGPERDRRRAAGEPLLAKPITSELGNVTPWIIVPGPYTERELDFQAENIVASVVNNASFNCIATRMIVTHRGWPGRARFLDKIQTLLGRIPPRKAYYPGAAERYARYVSPDRAAAVTSAGDGTLPWTLVRDVDPASAQDRKFFREESFAPVVAETALDAPSAEDFLDRVADFANEQLWGTLGVSLTVHPKFRRAGGNEARLRRAIARLRYGSVAINHWTGLCYALMSLPWGGAPGSTLAEPESGIGWVHNSFLLDGVEKVVFEGPLTMWPKPFWFPTHRTADRLAWQVLNLYDRPLWRRLPPLLWTAMRG